MVRGTVPAVLSQSQLAHVKCERSPRHPSGESQTQIANRKTGVTSGQAIWNREAFVHTGIKQSYILTYPRWSTVCPFPIVKFMSLHSIVRSVPAWTTKYIVPWVCTQIWLMSWDDGETPLEQVEVNWREGPGWAWGCHHLEVKLRERTSKGHRERGCERDSNQGRVRPGSHMKRVYQEGRLINEGVAQAHPWASSLSIFIHLPGELFQTQGFNYRPNHMTTHVYLRLPNWPPYFNPCPLPISSHDSSHDISQMSPSYQSHPRILALTAPLFSFPFPAHSL